MEILIGLTYFAAAYSDINRSDDENQNLQERGFTEHNDRWAYFSRPLGAVFIPITTDGSVFIGERTGRLYTGWLNAAAGFVDYKGEPSYELFLNSAINELIEEYGRGLLLTEPPRFAGIASSSIKGDADMVWTGRINVPAEYFLSGKWAEERIDSEHAPQLLRIATVLERDQLLHGNTLHGRSFPGVMYSTRLGLETLTEADFLPL